MQSAIVDGVEGAVTFLLSGMVVWCTLGMVLS